MKKITAFAASNSSVSINHQLVTYAASLVQEQEKQVIKLTDFSIPVYSEDIEKKEGIPAEVQKLNEVIKQADHLIISVAEHNGSFSAFFKNIIDWLSRNQRDFLAGKKILLLSTSPGTGAAASALAVAEKTLPFFGGEIASTYSMPSFYEDFSEGRITNAAEQEKLAEAVQTFISKL